MIIALICVCLVVALDQVTKFLIYGTAARSILGNIVWFESTLNTGVAFSMFSGAGIVFIVISSLASALMLYLIISNRFFKTKFEKITLGVILGGTIGNLIDRIAFNGVRDFIYLKFINFAIFNVADMAITLGVIVLCVYYLVVTIKKEKNNKNDRA